MMADMIGHFLPETNQHEVVTMMLRFENITKRYGEKTALNGISLKLEEGIYGLLGPNGAGKSTMMNLITGNLKPSEGRILFDGREISEASKEIRSSIGYMPQSTALYSDFTGIDFLRYIASMKDMGKRNAEEQIETYLKRLDLYDVRNRKIRTWSGGMKQRLMLIQAMLNDPKILILDEPTAGMDPKQRIIVSNMISEKALNSLVLISTHVTSDVEFIAGEIILLKEGKVLRKDTVQKLTESLKGKVWTVYSKEEELERLYKIYTVCAIAKNSQGVSVRVISDGRPFEYCEQVRPVLSDVYMYYFGEAQI